MLNISLLFHIFIVLRIFLEFSLIADPKFVDVGSLYTYM